MIFGGLLIAGYVYFRLTHDEAAASRDSELVRA